MSFPQIKTGNRKYNNSDYLLHSPMPVFFDHFEKAKILLLTLYDIL